MIHVGILVMARIMMITADGGDCDDCVGDGDGDDGLFLLCWCCSSGSINYVVVVDDEVVYVGVEDVVVDEDVIVGVGHVVDEHGVDGGVGC